jgi:hypothetical protein
MALDFSVLESQVAQVETVNGSAAALIEGLAAQIEETKGDPAKAQALADRLRAASEALSMAVSANTPSSPAEPTEEPVEEPTEEPAEPSGPESTRRRK